MSIIQINNDNLQNSDRTSKLVCIESGNQDDLRNFFTDYFNRQNCTKVSYNPKGSNESSYEFVQDNYFAKCDTTKSLPDYDNLYPCEFCIKKKNSYECIENMVLWSIPGKKGKKI